MCMTLKMKLQKKATMIYLKNFVIYFQSNFIFLFVLWKFRSKYRVRKRNEHEKIPSPLKFHFEKKIFDSDNNQHASLISHIKDYLHELC